MLTPGGINSDDGNVAGFNANEYGFSEEVPVVVILVVIMLEFEVKAISTATKMIQPTNTTDDLPNRR